jgi:hypothetical protein
LIQLFFIIICKAVSLPGVPSAYLSAQGWPG